MLEDQKEVLAVAQRERGVGIGDEANSGRVLKTKLRFGFYSGCDKK